MIQGRSGFRGFSLGLTLLWAMARAEDPFAGMTTPAAGPLPAPAKGFFRENFTFKKELYSQFSWDSGPGGDPYSRQSVGMEALKVFSSSTAKVASLDIQARLVRRDRFAPTVNDREGMDRPGWFLELHNLYLDLYDVVGSGGQVNVRAGRFYPPFGLNLQTDTHGTLLQLSNERNFGFERDWYAGLWGAATEDLNYDVDYLMGSGYDLSAKGQDGLAGARLSLANRYRNEFGLEGGVSFLGGERLDMDSDKVRTLRTGLDGRWTHLVPAGSLSLLAELSAGRDNGESVFTELYQAEVLTPRRQWGLSAQYRRFWQDLGPGPRADASVFGELAYYFRNDVGGAFLDSLRLNLERQVERQTGSEASIVTLQYYRYW